MTTQITTKKEIIEALAAQGVTGPAAQLAAKQGAAERHAARVAQAHGELRDELPCESIFHALLDEIGIGGVDGLEGAASERYPYLGDLPGKQAGSGGAWTAAIREAAELYAVAAGIEGCLYIRPAVCEPNPSNGQATTVAVAVGTHNRADDMISVGAVMPCYPGIDEDGEPNDDDQLWWRSMAGLAVRALLGMPVRRATTLHTGVTCGFYVHRDDLTRWATVFNACCDRLPSDDEAFRHGVEHDVRGGGWIFVEVA